MADQSSQNEQLSSGHKTSFDRPPTTKAEVAEHLTKVIKTIDNVVNNRNTDERFKDENFWSTVIADDFGEEQSLFYGQTNGRTAFLKAQEDTVTQWPEFRLDPHHIEVDVDLARGVAETTQLGHMLGCPPGVQRPWMTNMKWKKTDDNDNTSWRMVSTKSMFGPSVENLPTTATTA